MNFCNLRVGWFLVTETVARGLIRTVQYLLFIFARIELKGPGQVITDQLGSLTQSENIYKLVKKLFEQGLGYGDQTLRLFWTCLVSFV